MRRRRAVQPRGQRPCPCRHGPALQAALGTLANITLYAVTANLTTQPLAAAQAGGAAGAAQYTTTLTATLSGGWAEVATPLASLPRIELAGLRADTAAQVRQPGWLYGAGRCHCRSAAACGRGLLSRLLRCRQSPGPIAWQALACTR